LYFVSSGRVRVHDRDVVLARLGPGEVFGEMGVLDPEVRTASVSADCETTLIALERDDFYSVLENHPEAFRVVIRSILRRERTIVQDVTTRTEKLLGYEKELEIGRRIQQSFLPERVPKLEHYEIDTFFKAAREVAGDYYDLFPVDGGSRIAVVIGDVCDKGVGASLFMTLFRSLLRAYALFGTDTPDAATVSGKMDELLLRSVRGTNDYVAITHRASSMFSSLFFGFLDPDNGTLSYVNAGHEAPIVFRADGAVEQLEVTGGVIGLFRGAPMELAATRLERGDLLFAYTDGVNEAKDSDGRQFTEARLLALPVTADTRADELLQSVDSRLAEFRGSAEQSDDITMIALKRVG
jgi:sigma-B regulation protein RsbU (phosphoserine phosphatase)